MSDPTTRQLLSTHALASAAFDYGRRVQVYGVDSAWSKEIEQRLRPLLLADMADPLPRARDIAARVHDLDELNRAHPGLTSGVEERERIVGDIRRLMGGVS